MLAQGLLCHKAMPAIDILRHMDPAQVRARESVAAPHGQVQTASLDFDDLLDVVNPLHHLPVVGTLYRAISGDAISAVPKIAGNALYGGLWGAVSAIADTAFEAITGKDFGSTLLALASEALGLDDDKPGEAPVRMAGNAPPSPTAATASPGEMAFGAALAARNMDTDLASRAMFAYRRSQDLVPAGLN